MNLKARKTEITSSLPQSKIQSITKENQTIRLFTVWLLREKAIIFSNQTQPHLVLELLFLETCQAIFLGNWSTGMTIHQIIVSPQYMRCPGIIRARPTLLFLCSRQLPGILFRNNFLADFPFDQDLNKISRLINFCLIIKENEYTKI